MSLQLERTIKTEQLKKECHFSYLTCAAVDLVRAVSAVVRAVAHLVEAHAPVRPHARELGDAAVGRLGSYSVVS